MFILLKHTMSSKELIILQRSLCFIRSWRQINRQTARQTDRQLFTWADTFSSLPILHPSVEPTRKAAGRYGPRWPFPRHLYGDSEQIHLLPRDVEHVVLPSQTAAVSMAPPSALPPPSPPPPTPHSLPLRKGFLLTQGLTLTLA